MGAYKLLYFCFFAAYGAVYPYVSLYFKRLGMSGAEIGVLTTLPSVANILAPPLAVALLTRLGMARTAVPILLTAGLVPATLLLGTQAFWPLFVVYFWTALLQAPVPPLLDDATLRRIERTRFDYGRIRLWGSVGFIVAVGAVGILSERAGLGIALFGQIAWMALSALVAWLLARNGELASPGNTAARQSLLLSAITGLKAVWREPGAPWLFGAGILARLAGIAGTNFFAVHADDIGMAESLIGGSWVIGVSCEVALMAVSGSLMRRFGAERLFFLSMVAGAVRWAIYATTSSPWVLLASQTLHALNFGALHIAAVTLIHSHFAPERRTDAQTAWAALTVGVPGVVGALLTGSIYDLVGLRPLFWASAVAALVAAYFARRLAAKKQEAARPPAAAVG